MFRLTYVAVDSNTAATSAVSVLVGRGLESGDNLSP